MDIHYIHTGTVWEWVMPPWPVAVHWCPSPLQTFIELFPKHLVKIIPKIYPYTAYTVIKYWDEWQPGG